MEKTTLYPLVQFKKDTWEIDEFDNASAFLLVGSKKALLIDTGCGIGDLRGLVESITDRPVTVVLSSGSKDHTGHIRQFDEVYVNGADPIEEYSTEELRISAEQIRIRQIDSVGSGMYSAYPLCTYDPDTDITGPEGPLPEWRSLKEGDRFDLGDGRVVEVYAAPGSAKGQMMLLDPFSGSLFVGNALNYCMELGAVSAEESLRYVEKMESLAQKYDGIYNSHHDFRALGAPLKEDCLPALRSMLQQIIDGTYRLTYVPGFLGPAAKEPAKLMLCADRSFLRFPGLEDPKMQKMTGREVEQ